MKSFIVFTGLLISFAVSAGQPNIIQPSSPGMESNKIDAAKAIEIADTSFTQDDVVFLEQMIVHHQQALTMSAMAPDRTNSEDILDLAGRIEGSQDDEISFMQDWLTERDIKTSNHHGHHMKMMGMASPEELDQLASTQGTNFDKMFLKLMILHHEGAIDMVNKLKDQPGSAYDPILYDFVSDLTNDQGVEIERMNGLLTGLSTDPRASLQSGLYTAESAILNLDLVASLKTQGIL